MREVQYTFVPRRPYETIRCAD